MRKKLTLAVLATSLLFVTGCKRKQVTMHDFFDKEKESKVVSTSSETLDNKIAREYDYGKSKVKIEGPKSLEPEVKSEYIITLSSDYNMGEAVIIALATSPSKRTETGIYFHFNETTQETLARKGWQEAPLILGMSKGKRIARGFAPIPLKAAKYTIQGLPPFLSTGIKLFKNSLIPATYVNADVDEDKRNLYNRYLRCTKKAGKGFRVNFSLLQ